MSLLGSIYHSSNKNMEESKEKNFSIGFIRNEKKFILEVLSCGRTFKPSGYNLMKNVEKKIKALLKSNEDEESIRLSVVSEFETIKAEGNQAFASFLFPDHLNITTKIPLDLAVQDNNGELGLRLDCVLRKT